MYKSNSIDIFGHVCHDVTKSGIILGGSASYASLLSTRFFNQVKLHTSFGEDFLFLEQIESHGIIVNNTKASATTTFENIYKGEDRTQFIHARAKDIEVSNHQSDLIFLTTIADEIDFGLTKRRADTFVASTIQGSLRSFDQNGLVLPKYPDVAAFREIDLIFLSDEDISPFTDILDSIIEIVPFVVCTHGSRGASIYHDGSKHSFPAFKTNQVVDPTGAGDAFSTAFLYGFHHTKSFVQSMALGHATASLIIEHIGLTFLPDLDQINKRAATYIKWLRS